MPTNPWLHAGLAAYSVLVTFAGRRLVRATGAALRLQEGSAREIIADLVWVLLVYLAGLIAARYIERVSVAVAGYAVYCLVACGLSLGRARLYSRAVEQPSSEAEDASGLRRSARRRSRGYAVFVGAAAATLVAATFPIAASDVFRRPYSPVWDVVDRTMARLRVTYNPTGGGQEPEFPAWRDPADAGLAYQLVTLITADGLHLAAWYVPAPHERAPTIILAHGLQDCKWTLLRLLPWLHDAEYNVMMFDFRGHGESDKRPTTLGPDEVMDVQAALDWLEAQGQADRVVGLGMSLGAAALVNTAVNDPRLDALVLDSLFAEWENVDYGRGYRLPPDWLVPGVPDPVELVRQLRIPLFFVHGTADILTRVEHAKRLYAAANEPKLLWINDSGHAWSAWTYPEAYQSRVLAFLRDALVTSQGASTPAR